MSQKEIPTPIKNQLIGMQFDPAIIQAAWVRTNYIEDVDKLMLMCLQILQDNNRMISESIPSNQGAPAANEFGLSPEEFQLNQAIYQNMAQNKQDFTFQPLNPQQRQRQNGVPVGLKNIGNTCYFNSLLQSYFMNLNFVDEVLKFSEDQETKASIQEQQDQTNTDEISEQRKKASIVLIRKLQKLFSLMISSDRQYVDPSEVINNIVDEMGNKIQIGEQQDIVEFNCFFLSRIDEALQTQEQFKQLKVSKIKSESEGNTDEGPTLQRINSLNESSGQSPEKKSRILVRVDEQSMLTKLFFGKSKIVLTYPLGDQIYKKQEIENFNFIFLEVKFGDIYSALEQNISQQIEGYRNDKGDFVKAEKTLSILKPPDTLFLQIQRVVFDKEFQMLKQLNDNFQFEKEFYVDRFLQENREEYMKIRQIVLDLKKKRDTYQNAVEKLQNFLGQNANISASLKASESFLGMQSNQTMDLLNNPENFGFLNSENEIQIARQVLSNYNKQCEERINALKEEIDKFEKEIQQSFNEMQKIKYLLSTILVHDGSAEGGHYFAYIFDFEHKVWRKFNDVNVTQEKEENVMKNSLGGQGHMNAYCLVYVQESSIRNKDDFMMPIHLYQTSNLPDQVMDMKSTMIPEYLNNEIISDNIKLQDEIADYKNTNIVKQIIENYNIRFERTNEQSRKNQQACQDMKFHPPPLISYNVYLKNHTDNSDGKLDNIIKYQILDSCVKEFHPDKRSLNDIKDESFFVKLRSQLKNMNKFKAPEDVQIKPQDWQQIDTRLAEYTQKTHAAEITLYLYDSFLQKNLPNTFYALDMLIEIQRDGSKYQEITTNIYAYFHRLQKRIKFTLSFWAMSQVDLLLKENKQTEVIKNINMLLAYLQKHFIGETKFIKQLEVWFNEQLHETADEEMKQHLERIKNKLNVDERYLEGEEEFFKENKELSQRLNQINQQNDSYSWNQNKHEDFLFNELNSKFQQFNDTLKPWNDMQVQYTQLSGGYLVRQERELPY